MTGWRQADGIHQREVEDEVFLIPPDSDTVFALDAMGAAAWRLLEASADREVLLATFTAAFPDQPPERIAADLDALLGRLEAAGLIVPAS